jgi:hypothetical protein
MLQAGGLDRAAGVERVVLQIRRVAASFFAEKGKAVLSMLSSQAT